MLRHPWTRWIPLLALVLLAGGALPTGAQETASPDALFESYADSRGRCVDVGLALAAMSQTGTVAEAMAVPSDAPSLTAAGDRALRLVVTAPARVGACAEFEGFWGDGVRGAATARLQVLGPNDSPQVSPALAEDALAERGAGPRRLEKDLRAIFKIEKPGKYAMTALLEVTASQASTASDVAAADTVRDRLRVPFVIEVRESGRQPRPDPDPQPAPKGAISGQVLDAAGQPLEGAQVVAVPAQNAAGAPGATTRGALARTDAEGRYAIELPEGKYQVSVTARGYQTQWYDGKDEARNANPVHVKAGEETEDVDFALSPAVVTMFRGRVTDEDGDGLAGATVKAVAPASGANRPPSNSRGYVARTDENGDYAIELPAGTWLVAAMAPALNAAGGPVIWWDGKDSMEEADPITLAEGELREGVDFAFGPRPFTGIRGSVRDADGAGIEGVRILAQVATTNPAVPGRSTGQAYSAISDEDGDYELALPAGTWLVAATKGGTAIGGGSMVWWENKSSREEADPISLAAEEIREDVDFAMP